MDKTGTQAKTCEESRLENELVVYVNNTYSNNPIPLHLDIFPNNNHNQHHLMDALVVQNSNAPLYTQPTVNKPTQQDYVLTKHDNAI